MNENGFYSDRVEQPCIFYDEKEEPKAKVYVKKYDIKSKKLLTGAQFQIYPWIQEEEKYSDQALQTLSYNSQKQQYETDLRSIKKSGQMSWYGHTVIPRSFSKFQGKI